MTRSRALVVLAVLSIAAPASAEKLKAFEEALKKGGAKASSDKRSGGSLEFGSSDDGATRCGSLLLDLFCETVGLGVAISNEYAQTRRPGDFALPVLRLDGGYQRMVGRIDAFSMRGELGWRWLGAAYERLEMREHDPPERLSSDSAEVLLRTFGSGGLWVDWAAGYRAYTRGERHSGAQSGVSLGMYLTRSAGLEADLRWGSIADTTIADYRARWTVRPRGAPGLGLTAGYRVLRAGDATLHGPEAGLAWVW